jgi:hypothetical protein
MPANADQVLPVVRVGEIESEPGGQRWLVQELWGARSVGVIGGAPKCANVLVQREWDKRLCSLRESGTPKTLWMDLSLWSQSRTC